MTEAIPLPSGLPLTEAAITQIAEVFDTLSGTNELLSERLAVLEDALGEAGWQRLGSGGDNDFSREGLRKICAQARVMWLGNPLIKAAVRIQTLYVWGQGVSIRAAHPDVDQVVQACLKNPTNIVSIAGAEGQMKLEESLELFGNIFFSFFTNPSTGAVKIHTIPFGEIADKICDPENAQEPWYYLRIWTVTKANLTTGMPETETRRAYYPDWRYATRQGNRLPRSIGQIPVADAPVYHVAVNCLDDMKWGVSEMYAALPWATSYKQFLENWVTIVRTLARFAMRLTTKGGKKGVAASADKLKSILPALNSSLSQTGGPAAPIGSTFVSSEGTKLEPIKTAGVTTSCDDARRLLLMVCSATGISEHYLAGDPSTGNLATAKSMERPMELQFTARQNLWRSVYSDILSYVVYQAATAASGPLAAGAEIDRTDDEDPIVTLAIDPETGEPMTKAIEVRFPSILEHNILEEVQAVTKAATLDNSCDAGVLAPRYICKAVLDALGEPEAAALAAEWYPEEGMPEDEPAATEEALATAIGDLAKYLKEADL